jgi:hypothetical protein
MKKKGQNRVPGGRYRVWEERWRRAAAVLPEGYMEKGGG